MKSLLSQKHEFFGHSPEQTADLLDVPMALVLDVQKELNEQN